jgi:hypothetical protein
MIMPMMRQVIGAGTAAGSNERLRTCSHCVFGVALKAYKAAAGERRAAVDIDINIGISISISINICISISTDINISISINVGSGCNDTLLTRTLAAA